MAGEEDVPAPRREVDGIRRGSKGVADVMSGGVGVGSSFVEEVGEGGSLGVGSTGASTAWLYISYCI